jgi:hypothetical protein
MILLSWPESGGVVVQLFSRAMTSTFARSSIAARQVVSVNSVADFEFGPAQKPFQSPLSA